MSLPEALDRRSLPSPPLMTVSISRAPLRRAAFRETVSLPAPALTTMEVTSEAVYSVVVGVERPEAAAGGFADGEGFAVAAEGDDDRVIAGGAVDGEHAIDEIGGQQAALLELVNHVVHGTSRREMETEIGQGTLLIGSHSKTPAIEIVEKGVNGPRGRPHMKGGGMTGAGADWLMRWPAALERALAMLSSPEETLVATRLVV